MNRMFTVMLILLICLTGCGDKGSDVTTNTNDNKDSDVTTNTNDNVDSEYGLFDNVQGIEVIVNGLDYTINPYSLIINEDYLDEFINDVRAIENASEQEFVSEKFDKNDRLFNGISSSPEDEDNLGITCVTLVIKYKDNRSNAKVYEFTDGYEDIFKDGDGIKIKYNNEITFYFNEDNVIINKVKDMVEDTLYYVQVYDADGNYLYTEFLNPYNVKTDEYTIEGSYVNRAFLMPYLEDYISNNDFVLYEDGEKIDKLPDDGLEHDIYIEDENGNLFQYGYDRRDPMKCIKEDNKYYCSY